MATELITAEEAACRTGLAFDGQALLDLLDGTDAVVDGYVDLSKVPAATACTGAGHVEVVAIL